MLCSDSNVGNTGWRYWWNIVLLVSYLSRIRTKPTKWHVHPAKTQISLGIRPVWSGSSLSAWRKLGSLVTHWAHSEDSDQIGRMPRLIWVFAGRTVNLFCHVVAHFSFEFDARSCPRGCEWLGLGCLLFSDTCFNLFLLIVFQTKTYSRNVRASGSLKFTYDCNI